MWQPTWRLHFPDNRADTDHPSNPSLLVLTCCAAVKILRGHSVVDYQGVLDVAFHPTQPWAFTAGADTTICLFVNP